MTAANRVMMYAFNERVWHWLQGLTILILLITGAEIHSPERVSVLGFSLAIQVHNGFSMLLVVNAVIGLIYFLASGLMRQYVPVRQEFSHLALRQMKFYLHGIFKGEPHPMEHGPRNKLNPLQKITYLAILNLLLPLQLATGLLIWSMNLWPAMIDEFGGLNVIVPIHVLAAWFFLAFTIMHVYLTTTGERPMSNIKAMIVGYIVHAGVHADDPSEGASK